MKLANRAVGTALTLPLKLWLVGLELVGIYVGPTVLALVIVGGLLLIYGAAVVFHLATPSFAGAGSFVLDGLLQQPLVAAWLALEIIAGIFITRAAFRNQAWAHWGAVALIGASLLPPIVIAVAFRELVVWVIVLFYGAGCIAFLMTMTYVYAKHGPWGVTTQLSGDQQVT
jgi:hypothetical protein